MAFLELRAYFFIKNQFRKILMSFSNNQTKKLLPVYLKKLFVKK